MKKRNISDIIITLLTVLFLLTCGCIHNPSESETLFLFHYEIILKSNNTTTVIWPIPVSVSRINGSKNEHYSKIIDLIGVESGEGTFKVQETLYGIGLNITFINSIHLLFDSQSKTLPDNFGFQTLSMSFDGIRGYRKHYYFTSDAGVIVEWFMCLEEHQGEYDWNTVYYSTQSNISLQSGWNVLRF